MFSVTLPLLYGLLATGQAAPEAAPPTPPAAETQAEVPDGPRPPNAEPLTGDQGDVYFGKDRDGRLRAIPLDEALQSGAGLLEKLRGDRTPATAPVYISRFSLDGDVIGERAEFKVSISIEVTRDEGWFDVPLALHEAYVHQSTYDGPGAQAPRTGGPAEEGLHWTVHGAGTHRLDLLLGVPLRQSPAGQQLQLKLPRLPDLFRARCHLRIPGGPVAVTTRGGTLVPVHPLATGGQEIELDVAGQRLDLTWRRHVDEAPSLSTVITSFDLHRRGERLEFTATQQCDVEQGTVTRIEVRLPTDQQFHLDSIGRKVGQNQPDALLKHADIEGRPGWIQVELDEPMSGRFELEWQFARPFPISGDRIQVDGLELAAARTQQGRVELQPIDGYDVMPLERDGSGLQETNPARESALKAFEFFKQPFQLEFEIARIHPKLIVTPRYYLRLDAAQAELYLELQASVLAGVVDELLIDWPTGEVAGWSCAAASVDVQSESGLDRTSSKVLAAVISGGSGPASGLIRLQLKQPIVGRPTETVRLRVVVPFSRVILQDETELNLTLPRLSQATTQPGALFIAGGIKLEPFLPVTVEPLEKLPPPTTIPTGVPGDFLEPAVLGFSMGAQPPALQLGWELHSRTISAETDVSVVEARHNVINVVQRISYSVSYGELSSLLLELPPALDQLFSPGTERVGPPNEDFGVLLHLDDGTPLSPEPVGANLRIPLPTPRHGRFDLLVDYVLPVPPSPAGQPDAFELPIVTSLDAEFDRIFVSTKDSERIRLDGTEQGWTSLAPRSGGVAWQTVDQRSTVRFVLDESLLNVPQQYTISSAFLLTRIGEQGDVMTLGEYVVRDAPRRLLINMPHAEGPVEFRWEGTQLDFDRQEDRYTLDLPTTEGELTSGRLSVKYRSPPEGTLGLFARRSIEFPRFPSKVWVTETWFEIVLPPGSQLFAPPPDMAPQYTWQRQVAVWMRQFTPEYLRRRAELFPESADSQFRLGRGNSYAFSAVGTVTHGTVGAMSQSLIVLIGAGLTLLLGFVLGRVPATRNVFTLLVLGFLFALASIWYLELMQLLLQPALLGLLLAAVATAFDAATRRRLALSQRESSLESPRHVDQEPQVGRLSSISSPPARTAVYRSMGTPDSGGPR